MKTNTCILMLLFSAHLLCSQSMIIKMYTDPAEPTNKDTVLILTEYQFPSSPCLLDSKGVTPIDSKIQAFSHYCLGPLTAICNAIDTFKLDPMEEGEYTFILSLSSGMGDVPCSPGIVIDDLDTLQFNIHAISKTEDPDRPDFYIFPNPATDVLGFSVPLERAAIILSATGQKVLSVISGSVFADVSELSPGMYLIKTKGQVYRWVKY